MISLLNLGPIQSTSDRAAQTRAVKDEVRRHFGLDADDSIFVAEITCGETECPDVETVIAVFLAGSRCEFRIHKPVASVTKHDVAALQRSST
jgi:hypothetical protein